MTNLIYSVLETPILFADSAQTPDAQLTLTNLSANNGRISAKYDRGAGAKPAWYAIRATMQMGTAGVIGESAGIYISSSNNVNPDGEEGTADAALSALDKLRNMHFAMGLVVDITSTNTDITGSDIVFILERYFSVVFIAPLSDGLRSDTSVHQVILTPIADQIQNSV